MSTPNSYCAPACVSVRAGARRCARVSEGRTVSPTTTRVLPMKLRIRHLHRGGTCVSRAPVIRLVPERQAAARADAERVRLEETRTLRHVPHERFQTPCTRLVGLPRTHT